MPLTQTQPIMGLMCAKNNSFEKVAVEHLTALTVMISIDPKRVYALSILNAKVNADTETGVNLAIRHHLAFETMKITKII